MSELQLELETVIEHRKHYPAYPIDETSRSKVEAMIGKDHPCLRTVEDTHKPAGIRLAKMLHQYDDSPSSQLWSDIQAVSLEILKPEQAKKECKHSKAHYSQRWGEHVCSDCGESQQK